MNDEIREIYRRLDRIERRLDRLAQHDGYGPPRWGPPPEVDVVRTECRFDEKRLMEHVVAVVTQRLEETLRLIPQVLEADRSAHEHRD